MTEPCAPLHAYVDGELDADETAAFEAHLVGCDACQDELPRLLALMAALDHAATHAAPATLPAPPRLGVLPGGAARSPELPGPRSAPDIALPRSAPDLQVPSSPPDLQVPSSPPDLEARAAARRRPRWLVAGLAGLAAAALLLVVLRRAPTPVDRVAPAVASLAGDLGPRRTLEARLSYPGADRYRALDVARGAADREDISLARMAELEAARDWHGLAVAALLAGEPARAASRFAQAAPSPAVDSDLAALELRDGSPAALERGLAAADRALEAAPDHGPALWNRALVLAALNLPLAAARDLDRVAALGEAGWADEARTRAQALRAAVRERRVRWQQATRAGQQLIEDGTPPSAAVLPVAGQLTIKLYDAIRAAPSRERVEALLPIAQALDAGYRSQHLAAYVRKVAASDFRIRAPLAAGYRALALGQLDDRAAEAWLQRFRRARADDLTMGAIVLRGQLASRLEEYRRLAAATQDPWFELIAEQQAASDEIARGQITAAERRLRAALERARRERLGYRALLLEVRLVELYREGRSLAQAYTEAQIAYRDATALGEGVMEINTLLAIAGIALDRYADGLSRAYLTEILDRTENTAEYGPSPLADDYNCSTRQYGFESLANLAVMRSDLTAARAALARAPTCVLGPSALGVLVRSELYRLDRREEDAQVARAGLATLRAGAPSPALGALLSFIEGNLIIDVDPAAGRAALRAAIAAAGHEAGEFNYALKARAYAYALLALDAGRASRFGEVIDVLAETLEVPRPARCALAIAVQDVRAVVAFVDASGQPGGRFVGDGQRRELDAAALVPASIVARLRGCERVAVLARAPVLGAARLLPAEIAWSYILPGAPPAPATTTPATTTPARRVVIANPETPAELRLPPLGAYPDGATATTEILRGADATPSRVLQAIPDASVIEFHTHGFIANDVSEASYLVLSPELDHQYRMTADEVARVRLARAPLVILGACHAATSSRSQEGGMGLAEAFLRAGARAVVASPDVVQDLGAQAFFAAVRDRVEQGSHPATAVRDERVRRQAGGHGDAWAAGVLVFESW